MADIIIDPNDPTVGTALVTSTVQKWDKKVMKLSKRGGTIAPDVFRMVQQVGDTIARLRVMIWKLEAQVERERAMARDPSPSLTVAVAPVVVKRETATPVVINHATARPPSTH